MPKVVYHLFSGGVYFEKFYKFMTENSNEFNVQQKFVIIDRAKNEYVEFDNTICIESFKDLFLFYLNLKINERVILHNFSLLKQWILNLFFLYKVKLFSWDIWGADLYFYRIKNDSLKFRIFDIIRKTSIKHFKAFIVPVKGDYDLAKENYSVKGKCFCVQYPNYGISNEINQVSDESCISILLGNSGDKSNNHEDILDDLSRFSDQNIRIITPLSYGGDSTYLENVISKGNRLFGDKFVALRNPMPYDDYIQLLNSVSIMICNHNRQQALGNIWVLLSKGAKVYIKSDVTTYSQMIDYGILVYDTKEIKALSFNSFVNISDETRFNNSKIVTEIFSRENLVSIWQDIFNFI